MDAILLATIAGWTFCRGRGSERRAAWPTRSETMGHDVRTIARFESHGQTIRSHDGIYLAIFAGAVRKTGHHMADAPVAHQEKAGYGLRRAALSPVETLAQSISTI